MFFIDTQNPLRIYCHNCGAPSQFDIIHQTYKCSYCGEVSGVQQAHNRVMKWRTLKQHDLSKRLDVHTKEQYQCPTCGAVVIFDEGEAASTCAFCDTKLIHQELTTIHHMPEVIIPFFLTYDEAKQRMLTWGKKHRDRPEGRAMLSNINKLQGYYLPYELIYGPVYGSARRDWRPYHFEGYLDCCAVNTSRQFDNILLNDIEPFDFQQVKAFDYAYITESHVKLNDLSDADIKKRVHSEAAAVYGHEVDRVLHEEDISITMSSDDLIAIPALLPVYFIKSGKLTVLMNGQTGRIAASKERFKRRNIGFIEPLLYTVIATCLLSIPLGGLYLYPSLLFASFFGIVFFSLMGNQQYSIIRRITLRSENTQASREDDQIIFSETEDHVNLQPVFYETNKKGQKVPVKLRFFTLKRTILVILKMLFITFLPAIIAAFLHWPQVKAGEHFMDNFHISYGTAWYIIGVFLCIIYWCLGYRKDVFNHPIIYEIRGTKLKKISSFSDESLSLLSLFGIGEIDKDGEKFTLWLLFKEAPEMIIPLFGFLLFLLIGSVFAIIG